jgi:hypothetical protein
MATYHYMDHPDPAEGAPFNNPARNWDDRVLTCGYPVGPVVGAGENIAFGYATVDAVMNAWIASPPHLANLVNPSYTVMGAGVSFSNGVGYWAQDFGTLNNAAPGSSFAVTMRSLAGHATKKHGVVLHWRTASEINTAGFRVYRVMHGTRIRISHRLIAAAGKSGGGHRYTFRDRRAPSGKRALTYWIQSVDLDATKSWHGPLKVARR